MISEVREFHHSFMQRVFGRISNKQLNYHIKKKSDKTLELDVCVTNSWEKAVNAIDSDLRTKVKIGKISVTAVQSQFEVMNGTKSTAKEVKVLGQSVLNI